MRCVHTFILNIQLTFATYGQTSAYRHFCTNTQPHKKRRLFLSSSTTFVLSPPLRCWTTHAVDKTSLINWETKYYDYHLDNMQPGVWMWWWSQDYEEALAHGLLWRWEKIRNVSTNERTNERTNPLLQATSARQMFNSAPVWHLSVLHVYACVLASRRACQLFFSPGPQGK